MKDILYLECAAGIAGDMATAALLDVGASEKRLMKALESLPLEGFSIRISRVKKAGLDACDFAVVLDGAHENRDHDMAYLHGHDEHEGSCECLSHAHDGAVRACGDDCVARESGHDRSRDCSEHAHAHDTHDDEGHCDRGERACAHAEDCGYGSRSHDCAGDGGSDAHAHTHTHAHAHSHEHRGMAEIERIIAAADMSERARNLALRIFSILAQAEAKAHGVDASQVHFHEVGAVDSIVDTVAFAVCLDDLGIDDVVVECLHEGRGTVRCQHGVLSVPVPAVVNIASSASIPLSIMDAQGEFVTPTGAAIAAAVRTRDALPKRFVVRRVGLGAGKRSYAVPSLLRAMVIRECPESASQPVGANASGLQQAATPGAPLRDGALCATLQRELAGAVPGASGIAADDAPAHTPSHGELTWATQGALAREQGVSAVGAAPSAEPPIWKLECEVDDCTGEALGFAMERLFAAGAREAHFAPVFMKKSRPAYQIQVICDENRIAAMEAELFAHTTTIGVRRAPVARTVLTRTQREVRTPFGIARVKEVTLPDGSVRAYPEHDDVAALVRAPHDGMPYAPTYQQAYRAVMEAASAGAQP